jgi:hypothetical protein
VTGNIDTHYVCVILPYAFLYTIRNINVLIITGTILRNAIHYINYGVAVRVLLVMSP